MSALAPGTTGVCWSPITVRPEDLVVLDADRRLYVGLSRDGSYYHVVTPSQTEIRNDEGEPLVLVGQLTCVCKGWAFHRSCYRVRQAEAFEGERPIDDVAWLPSPDEARHERLLHGLDNPAGAGESVEASRG